MQIPSQLQTMCELSTTGCNQPFRGAQRRQWWKQQHQRQPLWWPSCGDSEGKIKGYTSMSLVGLQKNELSGQAKIFINTNLNTCSEMNSPLQEENAVACHKIKCLRIPLAKIYKDGEEKRNGGYVFQSGVESNKQKIKNVKRSTLGLSSYKKFKAAEPVKLPSQSSYSSMAVVAKQALKKSKEKRQQERKITGFYQVRRSSRKNKTDLKSEEKKKLDELIDSGKEEGLRIDLIDGKGRGVIATKQFSRGDFVVEYHGEVIDMLMPRNGRLCMHKILPRAATCTIFNI
ncbi:hypothetical protein STEG23_031119 [Scotinomys teguina]